MYAKAQRRLAKGHFLHLLLKTFCWAFCAVLLNAFAYEKTYAALGITNATATLKICAEVDGKYDKALFQYQLYYSGLDNDSGKLVSRIALVKDECRSLKVTPGNYRLWQILPQEYAAGDSRMRVVESTDGASDVVIKDNAAPVGKNEVISIGVAPDGASYEEQQRINNQTITYTFTNKYTPSEYWNGHAYTGTTVDSGAPFKIIVDYNGGTGPKSRSDPILAATGVFEYDASYQNISLNDGVDINLITRNGYELVSSDDNTKQFVVEQCGDTKNRLASAWNDNLIECFADTKVIHIKALWKRNTYTVIVKDSNNICDIGSITVGTNNTQIDGNEINYTQNRNSGGLNLESWTCNDDKKHVFSYFVNDNNPLDIYEAGYYSLDNLFARNPDTVDADVLLSLTVVWDIVTIDFNLSYSGVPNYIDNGLEFRYSANGVDNWSSWSSSPGAAMRNGMVQVRNLPTSVDNKKVVRCWATQGGTWIDAETCPDDGQMKNSNNLRMYGANSFPYDGPAQGTKDYLYPIWGYAKDAHYTIYFDFNGGHLSTDESATSYAYESRLFSSSYWALSSAFGGNAPVIVRDGVSYDSNNYKIEIDHCGADANKQLNWWDNFMSCSPDVGDSFVITFKY